MKFGMFFLAEFISTLFMSGLFATVYLGGWNIPTYQPGLDRFWRPAHRSDRDGYCWNSDRPVVFFTKMFLVYMVFIWIRGTWPRVRVDQILNFNWKLLVPISLALILTVAVLDKLIPDGTNELVRASLHLASNVLIAFIALEILRRHSRRQRRMQAEQQEAGLLEETGDLVPDVAEAAHAH